MRPEFEHVMTRMRTAIIAVVVAAAVSLVLPQAARADDAPLDRVRACGTALCTDRGPWVMHAASVYGSLGEPLPAVLMAASAGANTIRITDFLPEGVPPDVAITDEEAWKRVDVAMATAASMGLRAVLDLSSYRNVLLAQGMDPYAQDWTPFLQMAATRVSTVSGVAYRDDPALALVTIAGEPAAPNGDPGVGVPASGELTRFYRRTLATWSALAPATLVSAGGLSHVDWDSGIDWPRICALRDNDVCAIHVYGHRSLRRGLAPFAEVSQQAGKPWLMLETGVPQRIGDAERARWLTRVVNASWRLGAAGIGIWNIGPESVTASAGTYDINPDTPRAWAAVQRAFAGGPRRP